MIPFLSIIIPHYNAHIKDIYRCLNSIYSQELKENEFEVIIVEDCSSNKECRKQLQEYKYNNETPQNYNIIYHTENKRQGGARNTGVENAKGKFIQYVDQDDYFAERSLSQLLNIIKINEDLDIIMMDFISINLDNGKISKSLFGSNNSEVLTGKEFILKNQIPWEPWQYCYRRKFLNDLNLKFVENVRFEDVDYVMKATIEAKKMCYYNLMKIYHTISNYQTTSIKSNKEKIIDLTKCQYRVRLVGEAYLEKNTKCANIIISHHQFAYNDFLKRYLWRMKVKDFLELWKNYPPKVPSNFKLLNFTAKNPKTYIYTSFIFKPLFFLLRNFIVKLRRN